MSKSAPQNPDEAIDRALAALRNARPGDHLETRILASLRHRELLQASHLRRNRRWLPVTLSVAAASLVVLALFLRTSTHPSTPAAVHSPIPQPTLVTSSQTSSPALGQRGPSTPRLRALPRPAPPELTSFPAPPAPLTTQERLLLQIAHRGDQEDFKLLNPEVVARELAQNRDEVDRFFPPPPPFGPPAPHPSNQTSIPSQTPIADQTPIANQETPNEAHPTVR